MFFQLLYILKSAVFALKNRNGSVPPIVYKQLLEKTLSWFTEVGRTHGLERRPRDLKQAPREVYNSRKISCGPGSRAASMNTSADKIIVTRTVHVDRWKCGGRDDLLSINFYTNRDKFRVRVSEFHYETWALGISTVAAPMSDSSTLSEASLKKFIWNNIYLYLL